MDFPQLPNTHALVMLLMTGLALFLFSREKIPLESSSLALLVMVVVGFQLFPFEGVRGSIEPMTFFHGFGHEALIAVCALMIAGEALVAHCAAKHSPHYLAGLLDRGAKVQRAGWTPLHYAATGPNAEVVALLLGLGASIDGQAPNGNTPLMMAARFGDENSVKLLVQRGANKTLRNDRNQTAADLATIAERPWLLPMLK